MREWLMARGYTLAAAGEVTLTDRYTVGDGCVVIDAATALWREIERIEREREAK